MSKPETSDTMFHFAPGDVNFEIVGASSDHALDLANMAMSASGIEGGASVEDHSFAANVGRGRGGDIQIG